MLPIIERKQAIPQADDLEKGIPNTTETSKTFEPMVRERKLTYLVERSRPTWREWLLMGCTTFCGWMVLFVILGALAGPDQQATYSPTYNLATFNGPVVIPLGDQYVQQNSMQYVALIAIPGDSTPATPSTEDPAGDYSDYSYFSIPFFSSSEQKSSEPSSDLQKLLTLQPGFHEQEGVYVVDPVAPKDLLMALDGGSTAGDPQELASPLSALQTKLQDMMTHSQDGIVIDMTLSVVNETTSDTSTNSGTDKIDPGLFASVPVVQVDPYYVSPKDVKMNWFEALQACGSIGMQLVAIEDKAENQVILQLISKNLQHGEKVDFWTAGTNLWSKDRRQFFWATTGQAFGYTSWHSRNPNEPDFQNCVQITNNLDSPTDGSLLWNDYGCYEKTRFVCEAPKPATIYQGSEQSAEPSAVPKPVIDQEFSAVLFEGIPQQLY